MSYEEFKAELRSRRMNNILSCLEKNDSNNKVNGADVYCLFCDDTEATREKGIILAKMSSSVYMFSCGDRYNSIAIDRDIDMEELEKLESVI